MRNWKKRQIFQILGYLKKGIKTALGLYLKKLRPFFKFAFLHRENQQMKIFKFFENYSFGKYMHEESLKEFCPRNKGCSKFHKESYDSKKYDFPFNQQKFWNLRWFSTKNLNFDFLLLPTCDLISHSWFRKLTSVAVFQKFSPAPALHMLRKVEIFHQKSWFFLLPINGSISNL